MNSPERRQNSPLLRLFQAASNLPPDQTIEEKNLNLVVCAIRHYVLDASSSNILFKSGTKNHIIPFDGYDLVVSDGKFLTTCAVADLRLSSLIQRNIFTRDSVISRVVLRICYSERRTRHQFFLLADVSLSPNKNAHMGAENLPWLPGFDAALQCQPLLSLRSNFTSIWNITDPVGACWNSSSALLRITDGRLIPRGYTLTQMLVNSHGKNYTPLLVRVLAKSRLNYFARKVGKRLDMNVCPYQFDLLVGDDKSCCLAVFWSEVAIQAYKHIDIGSVIVIKGYRLKPSYKTVDYSACCFDPSLERFNLEISINEKPINGVFPFDIVEPAVIADNKWRLPEVPFNFISVADLNQSSAALHEIKLDVTGVVLYVGRWNREARRQLRGVNENYVTDQPDDSVTEGIVVSSLSGDKYLEEFHTGGYWMWRWLLLADSSSSASGFSPKSSVIRVKCYCTSQPELHYGLQPSDAIAISQTRFLVMNKSDATTSKFCAKWALTTTNESQLAVLSKLQASSPILSNECVKRVLEFSNSLPAQAKELLSFGGSYDYPHYPQTLEALVERFQSPSTMQRNNGSPGGSPEKQLASREIVGPVYLGAPQLEALLDDFTFLEQRCLLVHALLASVKYIPFEDVVSGISMFNESETEVGSPSKRRKQAADGTENSNYIKMTFASAWEERCVGFRGLGINSPHWRSLAWHWSNKFSGAILKNSNPPLDEGFEAPVGEGSPTRSRAQLKQLDNFVGFLHIQLLLLNQSVFVNGFVPVPEICCHDDFLRKASSSPNNVADQMMVAFVNACCDNYEIFAEKSEESRALNHHTADKALRQFFSSVMSAKSTTVANHSNPLKTSAILSCYGLGAGGVEISVQHLYPIP